MITPELIYEVQQWDIEDKSDTSSFRCLPEDVNEAVDIFGAVYVVDVKNCWNYYEITLRK